MKKIRNVDLSICNGEQMVAYNVLFKSHINDTDLALTIKCIDLKRLVEKKFDTDLIIGYIKNAFEKYRKEVKIFTSYEEVGKLFNN